ncbi:MAG: sulfur oxidation c-type cytochrome SoxA [Pseudomonadota bacterium]
MIRHVLILLCGLAASCSQSAPAPQTAEVSPQDLQSGYVFLTAETQALQDDAFANPGLLWVDRGDALFHASEDASRACVSCHQDGLQGAATRYPAIDKQSGKLLNLEGRINKCRTQHQSLAPLAYETDDLLALSAYISEQSKGLPLAVDVSGAAAQAYAQGENYFLTRRGQFNLSCQQCHTDNWGKQLRGDTISQGHGNGFPAYRLEWQTLGSLQRRLRDCDTGVRAEPLPYGDETYIALELYLAARAQGLELESPAVRR